MLDRAEQSRRGHGVVHHQRQALCVGGLGKGAHVHHINRRIADGFAIHQPCARIGHFGDLFGAVGVDKAHFYALARQVVGEEIIGAAIERFGSDDVVARFHQGLHGIGNRRHAAGGAQSGNAAFERGHTRFEHGCGGVHNAGVDVAGHIEIEQIGAVAGVVEGVRGGLVNRHRRRFGGGVGCVACVQGEGFGLHGFSFV